MLVFMVLSWQASDYPEQALVTTAYTGDFLVCDCPKAELRSYTTQTIWHGGHHSHQI